MHFTDYIDSINFALKVKNYDLAEKLLIKCVNLTEKESRNENCGVAPWYYEKLAILYRRQKRYKEEVEILERFIKQTHSFGVKPEKLKKRLLRVKEIYFKF